MNRGLRAVPINHGSANGAAEPRKAKIDCIANRVENISENPGFGRTKLLAIRPIGAEISRRRELPAVKLVAVDGIAGAVGRDRHGPDIAV